MNVHQVPTQIDCRWKHAGIGTGGCGKLDDDERFRPTERELMIDRLLQTAPGSEAAVRVLRGE